MSGVELTRNTLVIAGLISIALGIANCFFGYRIFRILLGIIGFVAGAFAGFAIVQALIVNGTISAEGSLLYQILGALIGGAICAVLLIFVYYIGLFLMGASMGFLVGAYITQALRASDEITIIVALGLALLGGVLALVLQRAIIIIATAISGAYSIALGGTMLFAPRTAMDLLSTVGKTPRTPPVLTLVAWFVLAVAGMVVQFVWTGKKKPKPAPAAAGAAVAGVVPQINVTVQQNVTGQPVQPAPQQPPIIVQSPPLAAPPPAVMPVIVQPAAQPTPAIPAPEPYPTPPLPAPEQQVVQSFPTPTAGGSKFCPNCGQPVAYGTSFCTNCGNSVTNLWL